MTNENTRLLALLERLGEDDVPPMDAERARAQQARVIQAINERASGLPRTRVQHQGANEEAQERPWRTRKVAWVWSLGLAAGVALAGLGWVSLARHREGAPAVAALAHDGHVQVLQGRAQVVRPGDYETRISGGFELDKGDLVQTAPASRARVTLRSDVRAELYADTRMRLGDTVSRSQTDVWLQEGKAQFSVARRPANGKFSVHAPDVDVTVHGTVFTVEVRQLPTGVQTAVAVTEGRVSVSGAGETHWLGAGETWTSHSEPPAHLAHPTSSAPIARTASTAPNRVGSTVPRSTLGEESALFAAAMSSKRRGNDEGALLLLEDFLKRYPTSPLTQNARVERFRLLKHLGRSDLAAAAAREYMVDDPDGFARDEARELALPSANSGGL